MTDERILELRKCGYTLREIGNEFGVSYQAIQYRLKGIHERLEEERLRSEFEKVQKRNHPIYKIKKKYQKEAEQLRTELELKNEEIERLKQIIKDSHSICEDCKEKYAEEFEDAKSEAREEFADKVYSMLCNVQNWKVFKDTWLENGECYWLKAKLDNLLKEMESENP